jgi:hypothetical protein
MRQRLALGGGEPEGGQQSGQSQSRRDGEARRLARDQRIEEGEEVGRGGAVVGAGLLRQRGQRGGVQLGQGAVEVALAEHLDDAALRRQRGGAAGKLGRIDGAVARRQLGEAAQVVVVEGAGVDRRVAHAEALQQAGGLLQVAEQVLERDVGVARQRQQALLGAAFVGEAVDAQAAAGQGAQGGPGVLGPRGRGRQARQLVGQLVEQEVAPLHLGAEGVHQLGDAGGGEPLLARNQAGDLLGGRCGDLDRQRAGADQELDAGGQRLRLLDDARGDGPAGLGI